MLGLREKEMPLELWWHRGAYRPSIYKSGQLVEELLTNLGHMG